MAAVTLLETRGLSRSFGGLKAVEKVDFRLEKGAIHAIIGPNGAGKTTFVSLLAGRIEPTSGSMLFEGRDITSEPAHRRVRNGIAYTFQITSIYPDRSVFENVALAAQSAIGRNRGLFGSISEKRVEAKVVSALVSVGLEDKSSVTAGNLAYGHQRLVEIAMGLALEPKLLILDEPTQGLSDAEIDNFSRLVRTMAQSTTILLIEHNMGLVMSLAERITVMVQGQILAEGTPEAIRGNPAVQTAYLGQTANVES